MEVRGRLKLTMKKRYEVDRLLDVYVEAAIKIGGQVFDIPVRLLEGMSIYFPMRENGLWNGYERRFYIFANALYVYYNEEQSYIVYRLFNSLKKLAKTRR